MTSTPASSPRRRRIAVLADTHDRLPDTVLQAVATADAIWHLGDVCRPETLMPLHQLARPLLVVRGNNDTEPAWPLEARLRFGPREFYLVHIPPYHPGAAHVILCGHTHVPRQEKVDGTWWLNPGTVGRPNKGAPPAWAWLDLDENTGEFAWTPQPL